MKLCASQESSLTRCVMRSFLYTIARPVLPCWASHARAALGRRRCTALCKAVGARAFHTNPVVTYRATWPLFRQQTSRCFSKVAAEEGTTAEEEYDYDDTEANEVA